MNIKILNLTKQLISIPSYVDESNDETKIATFIETFANKRLVGMPATKQYLTDNPKRFNLYLGNPQPELLVVGHLDTVQPQPGWKFNPIKPLVEDGKIFGLGASDMKGSLAAFLSALATTGNKINANKLGVLLYCDEEYDFAGIKTFVKKSQKTPPKIIVSLDGNLQLSSGCRGLIEISGTTIGKSGHSSKPFMGSNAITKTVEAIKLIDQDLSIYFDPLLGPTTTNLAFINGGSLQGNIIPAKTDFIFEIRTSSSKVNASLVIKLLKNIGKNLNVSYTNFKIRHDLAPWPPDYNSKYSDIIARILKESGLNSNPASRYFSGYIDTAMLESIYPNVPKFIFGAGGENQHSTNEFVPIKNLNTAQQVYEQLLMAFTKK